MKYSVFYRVIANWRQFIALLILCAFCLGSITRIYAQTDAKTPVNRDRLETNEELSESLANDILELSVAARNSDLQLIKEYFPPQISAKPFPSRPTATKTQIKWVGGHNWEAAAPQD